MDNLDGFIIEDGVLSGYTGPGGDVVIPDRVRKIDAGAFRGCTSLTAVTIPKCVEFIGQSAFRDCTGLASVTIPEGVREIDSYAFSGCTGLTSVTIPEGIEDIENDAFSGCTGLTSVTIPEGIEDIENGVFQGCTGLTSITIPKSAHYISCSAFKGCTSLTGVTIPAESVWVISAWAFEDCTSLREVVLPGSLGFVGTCAFANCPLRRIDLGDPETIFDNTAFGDTDTSDVALFVDFTDINRLSKSLRDMAVRGFARRYLSGEAIPDDMRESGLRRLKSRRKTLWKDPQCLQVILKEKYINAGNISFFIDEAAKLGDPELSALLLEYRNRNITQKEIDKAERAKIRRELNISEETLLRRSWSSRKQKDGTLKLFSYRGTETEITVPDRIGQYAVTVIGQECFSPQRDHLKAGQADFRRTITHITIPEGITKIGESAFEGCTGLTSVTILGSETRINGLAFYGCHNITFRAPADSFAARYARWTGIPFEAL